jgi:hypothetical protein
VYINRTAHEMEAEADFIHLDPAGVRAVDPPSNRILQHALAETLDAA